jgi:hypothetical protein
VRACAIAICAQRLRASADMPLVLRGYAEGDLGDRC